jgi:hypothetical protein
MNDGHPGRAQRRWLAVRIVGALLWAGYAAEEAAVKLLFGWPPGSEGHPPNWLYVPGGIVWSILCARWAWHSWQTLRSTASGQRPTPDPAS